jgi:hypothetical protein
LSIGISIITTSGKIKFLSYFLMRKNKKVLYIFCCILFLAAGLRLWRFVSYPRYDRDSYFYMTTANSWFRGEAYMPAAWRLTVNDVNELIPAIEQCAEQRGNVLSMRPILNSDLLIYYGKTLRYLPTGKYLFAASSKLKDEVETSLYQAKFQIAFRDGTSRTVKLDFDKNKNTWQRKQQEIRLYQPAETIWTYLVYSGGKTKVFWDDIEIKNCDTGKQLLGNGSFEKKAYACVANNKNNTPLFYQFLLALWGQMGISPDWGSALMGILLSLAMIWGVYQITYILLKSHFLALTGALMAAVYPYLVRSSVSVLRESIYIPFFCLVLTFAIRGMSRRKSWHEWFICGILAGMGILTRREGLELLLILLSWLVVCVSSNLFVYRRKGATGKYFVAALFCVTGILSITVPFLFYMHSLGSSWFPVDPTNLRYLFEQTVKR